MKISVIILFTADYQVADLAVLFRYYVVRIFNERALIGRLQTPVLPSSYRNHALGNPGVIK